MDAMSLDMMDAEGEISPQHCPPSKAELHGVFARLALAIRTRPCGG